MALKGTELVEKRNILNEMRVSEMTMVELRFLAIYLSKINAREMGTRTVRFPISDFIKIMEIQKVNISAMKETAKRLLSHVVNIPNPETGGFTAFQLFKECRVDKDKNDEWFVEIDAHDKAIPLFFEYKRDYFKYKLWNTLRLDSTNQSRMYEILKQHEYKGECTIQIGELKEMLGIKKNAYTMYSDFRRDVLEVTKKILLKTTDISFTYEPKKKGRGGKTFAIHFKICKNENYIDQLTLSEYIIQQEPIEEDLDVIGTVLSGNDQSNTGDNTGIDFSMFIDAFNKEFSVEEVEYLYYLALPYIQHNNHGLSLDDVQLKMYDYFTLKYSQLKANAKSVKKSRIGLLRSFIESDLKKIA